MRFRETVVALSFAGVCGASPDAAAQCAGFSDISANDQICTPVTWLKNRQITLGCTATTYCPLEPVSRLQMAAFMNRLADVATPRVRSSEESGGTLLLDFSSQHILCVTAQFPARTYSRVIRAEAVFSYEVNALQGVSVSIVQSVNGGGWTTTAPISSSTGIAGERSSANVFSGAGAFPSPTDTHRFAVRVGRQGTSVGNAITSWACHLQAAELDTLL